MKHAYKLFVYPIGFRISFVLLFVLSCTKISYSSNYGNISSEKAIRFHPVIDKLIKSGADSSFVFSLIASNSTSFSDKYVKINVTGYLTPANYSQFYNEQSVNKSKDFINKYLKTLSEAELKYNVPKEVISSILWIETRHGNYLGTHHIPSVYLSTALASQKEFIEMNIAEMDAKFKGKASERQKLVEKIKSRAEKKSAWALAELLALEKMKKMNIAIVSIYGSWAGAFGISQFLPSSYIKWAVDGNNDGIIDLFNFEDAIHSVANYLNSNGWGNTEEKRRAAVFHYNNSKDYVDAVLKLAELSKI